MRQLYYLFLIVILVMGTVVLAQALSGVTSLEGTIKSVSADMLTVSTLPTDGLKIQQIVVLVNRQTQFDGFSSLDKLKEGDRVKVEYQYEWDKKIATVVRKQEIAATVAGPYDDRAEKF